MNDDDGWAEAFARDLRVVGALPAEAPDLSPDPSQLEAALMDALRRSALIRQRAEQVIDESRRLRARARQRRLRVAIRRATSGVMPASGSAGEDIAVAKGILVARCGCPVEQAAGVLRAQATEQRRTVAEVAREVIEEHVACGRVDPVDSSRAAVGASRHGRAAVGRPGRSRGWVSAPASRRPAHGRPDGRGGGHEEHH